jgi:hypothetical protein
MMTESVPPFGQLDALEHGPRVGQQLLEDPVDPAGVAPPLGRLLGLYRVELLEDLDRYREVVLLEFVNGLRVVNEDIRVQHERLNLCRDPDPRIWGRGPAQVFHRGGNIL